jgi:hypothetical protein
MQKAKFEQRRRSAPWIEPEAIAPASDEARRVSGATYDVTGGDSADYT